MVTIAMIVIMYFKVVFEVFIIVVTKFFLEIFIYFIYYLNLNLFFHIVDSKSFHLLNFIYKLIIIIDLLLLMMID